MIIRLLVVGYCVVLSVVAGRAQSYFLNGSAQALGGSCYRITPANNYQIGTVWYVEQLNLNEPFSLEFQMFFGSNNDNGADGMVWVLQNVGTNAIGVTGAGMGFQGFNPSFGIEFDTHPNNAQVDPSNNLSDPSFDHMAYLVNGNVNHAAPGNLAGPVQISATSNNVEDGITHRVKITWDPATQIVNAYFECVLRISQTVDLLSYFPSGVAYWGFTGSTGGLNNEQRVCLGDDILGLPDEITMCPGESVTLTPAGNPTGNFSWSPATYLDNPNIAAPTSTPLASITYNVSYTDLCNTPVQDQVNITLAVPPAVSAGDDASLCDGQTLALQGNAFGYTGQWTTTGGVILSGAATESPSVNAGGTYRFTVTSDEGCEVFDEVSITEIPLPSISLPATTSFCPGETATIALNQTYHAVQWSDGTSGGSFSSGLEGNYSVQVTNTGCTNSFDFIFTEVDLPVLELGADVQACISTGAVLDAGTIVQWNTGTTAASITVFEDGLYSCTATNQNCSVYDEVAVEIFDLPSPDLPAVVAICEGDTLTLDAGQQGTWNNGTVAQSIDIWTAGTFTITSSNGPCIAQASSVANLLNDPRVELGTDRTVCEGRTVRLGDDVQDALSVLWNNGSSEQGIEVITGGIYTIEVSNTCATVRDSVKVTFEECNAFIYAPNAFTPNYDGVNDVWRVSAFNVVELEINIFDRWGSKLFTTTDPNEAWQGNINNGAYFVEDGVYVYQIKYRQDYSIELQELRGTIVILR